jgi:hypothetical protein
LYNNICSGISAKSEPTGENIMQEKLEPSFCRKGGKYPEGKKKCCWVRWILPITGLSAFVWFLVRVVPKPSRAVYPCQRVAMPLASGFIGWLVGLVVSVTAFKKARRLLKESRVPLACLCLVVAGVTGIVSLTNLPERLASARGRVELHGPMGKARGIYPGRVVWVWDPNATDWDGYSSREHWYERDHTNLAVVEKMVSRAIQELTGRSTDAVAWDAVFRYFNENRGKGDIGYRPGEKIAIKINLTTCNDQWNSCDRATYVKNDLNLIDNSPQMLLALLRHIVETVGVDPCDISIGDPTCRVPNYLWDMLHPEFPDVRYLDNTGRFGRTRVEFSDVPFYWSTPDAAGKLLDYLPVSFAEADYIINFAVLKGHSSGITVCAKNHYGSLIRCPNSYLRDVGFLNYYDMHLSLPNAEWAPGRGHYRALVDLMGHPELGGKTLLYLIDGLYGGYYAGSHPYKWTSSPFGDNGSDWPSSLFASLDPVAIDSVAYDFLQEEWPDVVTGGTGKPGSLQGGAEDYLHEAALADNSPSGTFYDPAGDGIPLASLGVHEHWNNPQDKQYSRNLGKGDGIELIKVKGTRAETLPGDLDKDGDIDLSDFAIFARAWLTKPGDPLWNTYCDLSVPAGTVDNMDLAAFVENWMTDIK